MIILFFSLFIFILSNVILKISLFLSLKMKMNKEKMYPFECGFNQFISSRLPFSMRFFLITIIFLIFDVEIALLIPMINTFYFSNFLYWMISSILFIFILMIGLIHEWNQGALNWL